MNFYTFKSEHFNLSDGFYLFLSRLCYFSFVLVYMVIMYLHHILLIFRFLSLSIYLYLSLSRYSLIICEFCCWLISLFFTVCTHFWYYSLYQNCSFLCATKSVVFVFSLCVVFCDSLTSLTVDQTPNVWNLWFVYVNLFFYIQTIDNDYEKFMCFDTFGLASFQ